MKKKIFTTLGIILLAIITWIAVDYYNNEKVEKIAARPENRMDLRIDHALYAIEKNKDFDFNELKETFEYVEGRYDCSDFRLQSMMRIVYKYLDKIPDETAEDIKNTFLGFKYWMDQPGEDAMCYWSENHQLLFATSEYLAGQKWPDEIFTNDGKTGREHMEIGKERLLIWLELRWLYGFTEWYSNTYYVEDIAPLSNLIDFAEDEEIQLKATMVMDLLLHDVATQSYQGTFISSSGRMYERGKMSNNGNSMNLTCSKVWNDFYDLNDTLIFNGFGYGDSVGMDLNFLYIDNYETPKVIQEIGYSQEEQIIRASNGLNVDELAGEGLNGTELNQIMMQWAMEAFSNPEVVTNSVAYIRENNMLSNEFLHDFKMINFNFARYTGLLPSISRMLNPKTNGTAIQRANVYNYKTKDFMLVSSQKYHPGEFGDQHHIWNATIAKDLSIFTTHPASPLSAEGALSGSPGYWVGNGRNPHSAQNKNVVMSIYKIPEEKGFLEKNLTHFTHANFPSENMDTTLIDGNYAFGTKNNACFAFITKNELNYEEGSTNDLIQQGDDTFWIFEISTLENEGSFEEFIARIKKNNVSFENNILKYETNRKLELSYKGDFLVNGEIQETEFKRFSSPYSETPRKSNTIELSKNGHSLYLDFYNLKREVK